MNILYYYYFLFYTRVLSDSEPHPTTIFTLSLSESFLINGVIQILFAHSFCIALSKWYMITILVLIIGVNYLIYTKSGKDKKIIKMKPKIFNSNILSAFVVFVFFVISASFLFLAPIYVRQILEGNL